MCILGWFYTTLTLQSAYMYVRLLVVGCDNLRMAQSLTTYIKIKMHAHYLPLLANSMHLIADVVPLPILKDFKI